MGPAPESGVDHKTREEDLTEYWRHLCCPSINHNCIYMIMNKTKDQITLCAGESNKIKIQKAKGGSSQVNMVINGSRP